MAGVGAGGGGGGGGCRSGGVVGEVICRCEEMHRKALPCQCKRSDGQAPLRQ